MTTLVQNHGNSEINVPTTPEEWELYGLEGAPAAALEIGNLLLEKLTKAHAENQSNLQTAVRIRDEMYGEMTRFEKLGARDTEPECVLVDTIEKALGLESCSLSR